MSTESRASALLTALAADPALRDQLTHAPKDERAAIIEGIGFGDVSSADVVALAETLAPHVNDDASIDDDDLEVVTGGAGFAPILSVGAFIVY